MTPQVGIVIAVYNVEPYLRRCIDSVIRQSYDELQIILVDDGSTDASGRICDEYAAADSRIRVIHKSNGGLSDARNAGLAVASTAYVAFLDGDDWVEADMVERMLRMALSENADVVLAGAIVDVVDGEEKVRSSDKRLLPRQVITPIHNTVTVSQELVNQLGYAWNKLYRRELLSSKAIAFSRDLSLVEDIVFNRDVLLASERAVVHPAAFVHYVQRPRVTLGTQYYADFLGLRMIAVRALEDVLAHWGTPPAVADPLLVPLRGSALTRTVSSVLNTSQRTWPQRVRELHSLLADEAARSFVKTAAAQLALLRRRDRWVVRLLEKDRISAALVLVLARDSARRILHP